ncbi:hypothetical protein AJ79_03145 [Helicocarpus griseus UAMH5409]|uniref:protein-ribulosamine 3-kinase n=1 Tax=Helicocarpus griseus UAMH5409 TaxID=1447875 RepID=A0A2B7XZW8_9EURO|nr:hypothetical protein AJ79_03145 [Helicocarpus griseus UAMH5409]
MALMAAHSSQIAAGKDKHSEEVIAGNVVVFPEVLAVLPEDVKVISAESYGTSAWSQTGRINAIKTDGSAVSYFLKYVMKEHGEPQLKGEYTGMLELYNTAPHMIPKPYGWGRVASEPCLFFYVCDYIPLTQAMPDPVKLAKLVADLHKNSESPTGKFGFYLPTYDGWQAQDVGHWDDSWTSCFARLLKGLWELDADMNGHWDELDSAMEITLGKVIPRLIGILEQDGRSIKPCLIHGDLWETNIGTNIKTGDIFIFDAAAYYGHNEMEIGIWRVSHHKMKAKVYRQEYVKHFKKSEPVEEWDDRLKLYGVKTKLMYSAGVPGGQNIRQQALEDLLELIEVYGGEN